MTIKPVVLKYKTINQILSETQNRVGIEQYFNWHIYKNNCQQFIYEILVTLKKNTKSNVEFIVHNKKYYDCMYSTVVPTEFTLYMYNSIVSMFNLYEKATDGCLDWISSEILFWLK